MDENQYLLCVQMIQKLFIQLELLELELSWNLSSGIGINPMS